MVQWAENEGMVIRVEKTKVMLFGEVSKNVSIKIYNTALKMLPACYLGVVLSNFTPKIGCHGNAPLSLVYGSVTDEFPDSTNPISKPNSAWMSHTTEVMAIW